MAAPMSAILFEQHMTTHLLPVMAAPFCKQTVIKINLDVLTSFFRQK